MQSIGAYIGAWLSFIVPNRLIDYGQSMLQRHGYLACTGGVDTKEMLGHTDLTSRIAKEGANHKGSETHVTSTDTKNDSNEKWGNQKTKKTEQMLRDEV